MQRLACALVLVAGLAAADMPRGSGLPVVSAKSRSARAATRGHGIAGAVSAVAPRAASTDALLARGGAEAPSLTYQLITVTYFAGWYALNVKYNLVNKRVLNALPLPWLVATAQLGVGAAYAGALWALSPLTRFRRAPLRAALAGGGARAVLPLAAAHGAGQVCTVLSLGAGAVAFTHIVKALEPFFSAMVSGLALGAWMRPQVYATLLPVVAGVAIACYSTLSFSVLAFATAMGSNLAFACRAVFSKLAMSPGGGGGAPLAKLAPPDLFGVVTVAAFALCALPALAVEGASGAARLAGEWPAVVQSGLFHYLNNEVMYLCLGRVHPITLAVGNTMKRVVIIVAATIAFQTPMTTLSKIGSTVAILGVLLYSLTKNYYDALDAKAR